MTGSRHVVFCVKRAILRSTGAVLLIACSVWLAGCSLQAERVPSASQTSQTDLANLTTVTPAMMVGRESFPEDAIGNWRSPYIYDEYSGGGTDQGCGPLTEGWERVGNSSILASLDASTKPRELRYRVDLILPKNEDHPDISTVVEACPPLERNGDTVRIRRGSVTGIPSWATAYTVNNSGSGGPSSGSHIAGHYRGIDINVAASRNDSPAVAADMGVLAELFNDQIAKLDAQP